MKRLPSTAGQLIVPTLLVIAMAASLIAVAVTFSLHNGRLVRDTRELNRAITAADSELERLYDRWRLLMGSSPLGTKPTQAEIDALTAALPDAPSMHPAFADMSYLATCSGHASHVMSEVDAFGQPVAASGSSWSTGPLSGFKGMFAVNSSYQVRVAARARAISHYTDVEIGRTFTRSDAPIFQTAIFFEDDLELHPGEAMTIAGPVITNHRLYAAGYVGKGLTLASYVSYNRDYSYAEQPPAATGYDMSDWQPPSYPAGKTTQLSKAERFEPAGKEMRDAFDTSDSNPNNDGFREIIEKPVSTATDPATIAPFRFYNQASLRVAVQQTGVAPSLTQVVTVTGKDGAPVDPAVAAKVVAAVGARTPIYDRREQQSVAVTPVDVAKLGDAVNLMNANADPAARFNGIIYFSDESPDAAKRAFRLENGAQLPTSSAPVDAPANERGFSVATDAGLYIRGDYNTGGGLPPVPAAVLADAVMILSNGWQDSNAANPLHGVDDPADPSKTLPGTERLATATTVNTAMMAGTIPTGYDPTPNDPGNGDNYGASGGAHNFPRFLENWKGVDFTFKGSLVQLFTSQQFTGRWGTGEIYSPPNRNWTYNQDFIKHPSPGLFSFTTYSRGTWRRY